MAQPKNNRRKIYQFIEKQSLIKAIETIVSNRYITVPVYQYITSIDVNELVSSGYRLVYIRNPETYSIERLRELRSHRIAMLVDKVIEYPVKIPVVSIKKYKHYLIGGRVYVEPRIIGDVENIWKTLEAEEKEREYEKIIRLIELGLNLLISRKKIQDSLQRKLLEELLYFPQESLLNVKILIFPRLVKLIQILCIW